MSTCTCTMYICKHAPKGYTSKTPYPVEIKLQQLFNTSASMRNMLASAPFILKRQHRPEKLLIAPLRVSSILALYFMHYTILVVSKNTCYNIRGLDFAQKVKW